MKEFIYKLSDTDFDETEIPIVALDEMTAYKVKKYFKLIETGNIHSQITLDASDIRQFLYGKGKGYAVCRSVKIQFLPVMAKILLNKLQAARAKNVTDVLIIVVGKVGPLELFEVISIVQERIGDEHNVIFCVHDEEQKDNIIEIMMITV